MARNALIDGYIVTANPSRTVWTEQAIRALGVRIDGVTAVQIATGYKKTTAYALLQRPDELPFRVLKIGRRYVVPAADLLAALGLNRESSNP